MAIVQGKLVFLGAMRHIFFMQEFTLYSGTGPQAMSPEMVVNVATVPLPLAGHHHQGAGGLAVSIRFSRGTIYGYILIHVATSTKYLHGNP